MNENYLKWKLSGRTQRKTQVFQWDTEWWGGEGDWQENKQGVCSENFHKRNLILNHSINGKRGNLRGLLSKFALNHLLINKSSLINNPFLVF